MLLFWFCLAGSSILLRYVTISSLAFTTWDIGHCQYQRNPGPAQTDGEIVGKPNLEDLSKMYSFFVCIILVHRHTLAFKGLIKFSTNLKQLKILTCILCRIKMDMFTFSVFLSKLSWKRAQIKFHNAHACNNFLSLWDGKF